MSRVCLGAALLGSAPAQAMDLLTLPSPPPPNRVNYWEEWQLATTDAMAGPRASRLYRDTASHLDTWWRLAAFDRERPWISQEEALQARELATIGAVAGLQRVVRSTLAKDEALGVLHRIASTTSGANIEIRARRGQQPARIRYNAVGSTEAVRLQAADLEADGVAAGAAGPAAGFARLSPRGPPAPTFRTGVGFQLHDMDEDPAVIDTALAMTAFVDLRQVGVDAVRLQATHPRPYDWRHGAAQWSVTARQGLLPRLDLIGRVAGEEKRDWRPTRSLGALSLRLPTRQDWFLRTELAHRPELEATPKLPAVEEEWRGMVVLQANLRWRLPQEADGWPLGQEPLQPGRTMPDVYPRE
ncbi:MAG: hypothetical protein H6742_01960 [Alphaproteobacteria bacterium]|nr:hypothetical protein [Alphaproteobacteria bacterium]